MIYPLTHRFIYRNTSNLGFFAEHAFKDVYCLEDYEENIQDLAFPKNELDLGGFDPMADVLGDGWELNSEYFLKVFGYHPIIGLVDIIVCAPGTIGIDFNGTGINNKPGTAQAKYKGKGRAAKLYLKEDEETKLERCMTQSWGQWGVDASDTENIIVITNAKGVHWFTQRELLLDKIKVIGRTIFKDFTDNNIPYWDNLRASITNANSQVTFK